MRRLRPAFIAVLLAPLLNGCLVVGAASLATDVAVGTVGAAANVGSAVIGAAIPDGDDKDDEDD